MFDQRERLSAPDLTDTPRIRFLTTIDFPPFNFTDQAGRLSGFHVDLMREICAELQVSAKCQVEAVPYDELEAALEIGQGDVVIAGVAATSDLRRYFVFSRPYMALPARFARNLKGVPAASAKALAEQPVGVVENTTQAAMLAAFFPKLKATPFATRDAMLQALKAGSVNTVFSDGLQLSFWTAGAASDKCCELFDGPYFSEKFLGEGLTVMMRKSDTVLPPAINHALLALARKGRLQELYLRYFPNGLY